MIELQLLCYVLQTGDLSLLTNNNITPDKFSGNYSQEAAFIFNHFRDYGKVPDMATMLDHFNDFEVIEVKEDKDYLVKKFREDLIYRLQLEAAQEWGEALGNPDSEESLKIIQQKIDDIKNIDVGTTVGIDIIHNTERYGRYNEALTNPAVTGIPTKIKGLDKIINGILQDDLVVIASRTNQGKSFIATKLATNMWEQKKRVLFYSGENSVLNIGYRFDTLHKHFSNSGLMFGHSDLKGGKGAHDYETYVNELKDNETPFIVVTPKELNGQRMGVTKLKSLCEVYEPDIIFLDQISLMEDDRRKSNMNERFRYSHIMEDLRLFVEHKSIPVVIMSQTSRNNTTNEEGVLEPARIEHISESDGIGHNATKIITFAVNNNVLNMIVRKNTNGEKERGFKMIWDIDTGVFTEFRDPVNNEEVDTTFSDTYQGDDGGADMF